jgi:putative methyltransferase
MAQIQAEGTCSTRVVEIIPKLQDFLQVDPKDPMYVNVKGILLDPSCSGSGIINTPDRIMDEAYETCQKRIKALASFQLLALKHAMSFPQVRHIVYSTCSIQEEENEQVVGRALDEVNREIQEEGMTWVLVLPHALRRWKRRGKSIVGIITEEQAQALIRVDGADGDETNGFFVCYLERRFLTLEKSCEDDCPLALPTVVRGWYDGQFSIDRVEDDQNNGDSCRNHLQCDASIKDDDANKSSDKSVRKRQKKIEWKRKQKLQRLKRLKSQCV